MRFSCSLPASHFPPALSNKERPSLSFPSSTAALIADAINPENCPKPAEKKAVLNTVGKIGNFGAFLPRKRVPEEI